MAADTEAHRARAQAASHVRARVERTTSVGTGRSGVVVQSSGSHRAPPRTVPRVAMLAKAGGGPGVNVAVGAAVGAGTPHLRARAAAPLYAQLDRSVRTKGHGHRSAGQQLSGERPREDRPAFVPCGSSGRDRYGGTGTGQRTITPIIAPRGLPPPPQSDSEAGATVITLDFRAE